MLFLLSLLACIVTPQSPGGDDTNKHSGSVTDEVASEEGAAAPIKD